MTTQIGFNPAETLTSAENISSGKGWAIGDITRDYRGFEWIYVQASVALPQNNLVRVLASGTAAPWTSAGAAGTAGGVLCNAISASASIASDSYGWVMTKGRAAIKVISSSTGTIAPTSRLFAAASAAGSSGLVTTTATTSQAELVGLRIIATATTSTTGSAVGVAFFNGIQSTASAVS